MHNNFVCCIRIDILFRDTSKNDKPTLDNRMFSYWNRLKIICTIQIFSTKFYDCFNNEIMKPEPIWLRISKYLTWINVFQKWNERNTNWATTGKAVGGTMLIFNHKSQSSCMVLRLIILHWHYPTHSILKLLSLSQISSSPFRLCRYSHRIPRGGLWLGQNAPIDTCFVGSW